MSVLSSESLVLKFKNCKALQNIFQIPRDTFLLVCDNAEGIIMMVTCNETRSELQRKPKDLVHKTAVDRSIDLLWLFNCQDTVLVQS